MFHHPPPLCFTFFIVLIRTRNYLSHFNTLFVSLIWMTKNFMRTEMHFSVTPAPWTVPGILQAHCEYSLNNWLQSLCYFYYTRLSPAANNLKEKKKLLDAHFLEKHRLLFAMIRGCLREQGSREAGNDLSVATWGREGWIPWNWGDLEEELRPYRNLLVDGQSLQRNAL